MNISDFGRMENCIAVCKNCWFHKYGQRHWRPLHTSIFTSVKSTDGALSFCCQWVYLYIYV